MTKEGGDDSTLKSIEIESELSRSSFDVESEIFVKKQNRIHILVQVVSDQSVRFYLSEIFHF